MTSTIRAGYPEGELGDEIDRTASTAVTIPDRPGQCVWVRATREGVSSNDDARTCP